jgi:serine protease Do
MVQSVALDLMDDGKIQRGYIGVEITTVDETTAKAVGLDNVKGVHVNRVVKDGAASAAGVEVGDVILEIDDRPVGTSNELQNQIVLRRAGDKVKLTIWRGGKRISKNVTLKSLDGDGDVATATTGDGGAMDSAEPVKFKALGFSVAPLTKEQRKDYETEQGVLVTEVDNRGSVARRGLRPNSVILKADGKPVNSPGELKQILSTKNTGDGVLFVVKDKDGSKMAVTIEVPEDKS